jgi:hypothetical protein
VRLSLGWHRVLSAWALVFILILAGFAVLELVPSFDIARASPGLSGPALRGVRIPQFDPFDLGPPAFNEAADFDAEAHFAK